MGCESLGFIEVYGYITAIVAADAAVKSADVRILTIEKVKGGRVTVIFSGDVGAIKAAVDSAVDDIKGLGNYISSNIIPRPADGLTNLFFKEDKDSEAKVKESNEVKVNTEVKVKENNESNDDTKSDENLVEAIIHSDNDALEDKIADKDVLEDKVVDKDLDSEDIVEDLESMTLNELRKLARSLKIESMTPSQIKSGRKKQIVDAIRKHNEGGDK